MWTNIGEKGLLAYHVTVEHSSALLVRDAFYYRFPLAEGERTKPFKFLALRCVCSNGVEGGGHVHVIAVMRRPISAADRTEMSRYIHRHEPDKKRIYNIALMRSRVHVIDTLLFFQTVRGDHVPFKCTGERVKQRDGYRVFSDEEDRRPFEDYLGRHLADYEKELAEDQAYSRRDSPPHVAVVKPYDHLADW